MASFAWKIRLTPVLSDKRVTPPYNQAMPASPPQPAKAVVLTISDSRSPGRRSLPNRFPRSELTGPYVITREISFVQIQ